MKVTINIEGAPSEVTALMVEMSTQHIVPKEKIETVVLSMMRDLKHFDKAPRE